MTPEQISQFLDELGKRIGPAGDHLFQLIKQQLFLETILQISILLLVLVLSIVAFVVCYVYNRKYGKREDSEGIKSRDAAAAYYQEKAAWRKAHPGESEYAYPGGYSPTEYSSRDDRTLQTYGTVTLVSLTLGITLLIATIIGVCFFITTWVTVLGNPEWAAIQRILNSIPHG